MILSSTNGSNNLGYTSEKVAPYLFSRYKKTHTILFVIEAGSKTVVLSYHRWFYVCFTCRYPEKVQRRQKRYRVQQGKLMTFLRKVFQQGIKLGL